MKLAQLQQATQLAKELAEVEQSLKQAEQAQCFKLEMREHPNTGAFNYVGHCAGVSLDASGSFGELAMELRSAAVTYYSGHIARMRAQLRQLGVEL